MSTGECIQVDILARWHLVIGRYASTHSGCSTNRSKRQFPFLYTVESVKPTNTQNRSKSLKVFSQRIENEFHRYYNWVLYYNMISRHLAIYVCQGRFHTYYHFSFTPVFFFFFFFRAFFYYSLSKNVLPHVFIYIQLIFFSKFLLFHG